MRGGWVKCRNGAIRATSDSLIICTRALPTNDALQLGEEHSHSSNPVHMRRVTGIQQTADQAGDKVRSAHPGISLVSEQVTQRPLRKIHVMSVAPQASLFGACPWNMTDLGKGAMNSLCMKCTVNKHARRQRSEKIEQVVVEVRAVHIVS